MKAILRIGLILMLLVSCKGLEQSTVVNVEKITNLVESGNYLITLYSANPLTSGELRRLGLLAPGSTGNNIDITGNVSYIELKGDSLDIKLPFYGTRHSGVTIISNGGGIVYEGKPKGYLTSFNEKKKRITIRFEMKERSEYYDVSINVYPNGKAFVSINSTQRSSISYEGTISELE